MRKLIAIGFTVFLPILMLANFNNWPTPSENCSYQFLLKSDSTAIVHSDCPTLKRKCSGKIKWVDGTVYLGGFRFGKPHGKGTITYPNGEFYKGEFSRGYPEGFGIMEYSDGSFYEGAWTNGFKEGEGIYTFPGGHEYTGEFENDVMNGFGKIKLISGEYYEGDWKNGLADGNGEFTRKDGSRFIGKSENGTRNGEGLIIWESGDTLIANWENGILVEEATYFFSDGTQMVSIWENGELQDDLTYIDSNGNELLGSLEIMSHITTENDSKFLATTSEKLPLVFYGFAMEFQAMQNYELAEKHLDLAYSIDSPANETPYREMVVQLTANINSERVNQLMGRSNVLFRF